MRSACEGGARRGRVRTAMAALVLAAAIIGAPAAARAQIPGIPIPIPGLPGINIPGLGGLLGGGPQEVIDKSAIAQIVLQVRDQLQNSRGVSQQLWGSAMADLRRVNAVVSGTRSLTYVAGDLDRQFARRYGTYGAYAGRPLDGAAAAAKYQQWSEEANDNVLVALKGASAQAAQLSTEDADLRALESAAGAAEGRMQALQVGNQLTGQSIRQVQKLRQLMMLNTQLQANHMQAAQDRDALQAAASRQARAKSDNLAAGGERF